MGWLLAGWVGCLGLDYLLYPWVVVVYFLLWLWLLVWLLPRWLPASLSAHLFFYAGRHADRV